MNSESVHLDIDALLQIYIIRMNVASSILKTNRNIPLFIKTK